MKTKNILSISLAISFLLMIGCTTPQPYYDIPYDADGNVIFTGISEVTADPVSAGDTEFTINGFFPNAKSGDGLVAEVLKRQAPPWNPSGEFQLLPLEGTQKDITVGADLKASVTYTLAEAGLTNVGDAITVVFSGATDSGIIEIVLEE